MLYSHTIKLVRFYSGVDGLKTGYTGKAGYCLTATGEWKGMRLISVVMGEPSQDARTNDTVSLLNYGKGSYKINTILTEDNVLGNVEIELGERTNEDVILKELATDLVKQNGEEIKYTYEVKLDNLVAPVKKGDTVGSVNIYSNGELIMTSDVTVKNDVDKCSFWTLFKRVFSLVVVGNK